MGYAGSSVLADALDGVLNRTKTRPETVAKAAGLPWTDGALQELAEVPPFLRGRARRLAEERAREDGSAEVTREVFLESRP
jgi:light-independent protochlorophyllide reductase subunit B